MTTDETARARAVARIGHAYPDGWTRQRADNYHAVTRAYHPVIVEQAVIHVLAHHTAYAKPPAPGQVAEHCRYLHARQREWERLAEQDAERGTSSAGPPPLRLVPSPPKETE